MSFLKNLFNKQPTISYGITVCNESAELNRLLPHLLQYIRSVDQVIVLQDVTEVNQEVTDTIQSYGSRLIHIQGCLSGDFSSFKNRLLTHATGDYLFQLDADEIPPESLLKSIGSILKKHRKSDCFLVPRINIVHGIDEVRLQQWNWTQNEDGYINFPDYQMRLFKIKGKKIYWENKVHEKLVGFRKLEALPIETYAFCLIHEKNIDKQVQQNDFYNKNF